MAATNPPAARLGVSARASQQAIPKANNAMPAKRPTTAATPENSAPNSSRPTSDGTTIKATPVATSATAVRISSFFIQGYAPSLSSEQPGPQLTESACGP